MLFRLHLYPGDPNMFVLVFVLVVALPIYAPMLGFLLYSILAELRSPLFCRSLHADLNYFANVFMKYVKIRKHISNKSGLVVFFNITPAKCQLGATGLCVWKSANA